MAVVVMLVLAVVLVVGFVYTSLDLCAFLARGGILIVDEQPPPPIIMSPTKVCRHDYSWHDKTNS